MARDFDRATKSPVELLPPGEISRLDRFGLRGLAARRAALRGLGLGGLTVGALAAEVGGLHGLCAFIDLHAVAGHRRHLRLAHKAATAVAHLLCRHDGILVEESLEVFDLLLGPVREAGALQEFFEGQLSLVELIAAREHFDEFDLLRDSRFVDEGGDVGVDRQDGEGREVHFWECDQRRAEFHRFALFRDCLEVDRCECLGLGECTDLQFDHRDE